MKTLITATALTLMTLSAGTAFATGCHSACADGYTYSSESKTCVPKTVGS